MDCEGLVLVVLHGFAAAGGSFCGWKLREKHRPGNSGPVFRGKTNKKTSKGLPTKGLWRFATWYEWRYRTFQKIP